MSKIEYTICDNCKEKMEYAETCGGTDYKLSDGYCNGCGGKTYDFCSLDCLKRFVYALKEKSQSSEKMGGEE